MELQCIARLRSYDKKLGTLEKIGVKCVADALQIIPRTLCENSALNVNETMSYLLWMHENDAKCCLGVPNTTTLKPGEEASFDMVAQQVFDSLHTKRSVFKTAVNIAVTILSCT